MSERIEGGDSKKSDTKNEGIKEQLSNWSDRIIDGKKFDDLFTVEGMPLSWFYRPILYSSLLPRPFPSLTEALEGKPISHQKVSLYSAAFRKYLQMNDWMKRAVGGKGKKNDKEPDKRNDSDTQNKVLFLTFTNHLSESNSVFRIEGIIRSLEKEGKHTPFLLVVDPISRLSLKTLRNAESTLYQYYDDALLERAATEARALAAAWDALTEEQKKYLVDVSGRNMYPYLKHNLDTLYSQEFIEAVWKYYLAFRKIIVKENVKGIVLSSQNNIFEKCFIAAARQEKKPIFVIQHGIGLGALRTIDTPENVHFAVFGEKYRAELMALDIPKRNIAITGPVIFDELAHFQPEERKGNTLRILLATSPFIEDRFMEKEIYFNKIRKILGELYSLGPDLTIKLHPREKNGKEYQKIVSSLGKKTVISQEVDRIKHFSLIHQCDLLITFGSTVTIEGMILKKPTLTIELFDGHNPTNKRVIDSGATPVALHSENIAVAVQEALKDRGYVRKAEDFVRHLCYKTDGKAAQRIVKYMEKVMRKAGES